MTAAPSGGTQGVFIFVAVIVLIVVRRVYRNFTGVRVTHSRTIAWTAVYFALSGFFLATSFVEGVPVYYAALDAASLAAAAVVSHRVSAGRLKFWKGGDGNLYYKGGVVVYLVYVAGLVVRLMIEYLFVGPAAFTFAPISGLTQTAVLGLVGADVLFSFGYGLLVGRNIRVYSALSQVLAGEVGVTAEPTGASTSGA